MMLGTVQIAFCILTGSILFHVHWGSYLGTVMIVLPCYAAFATSSGMLLASLSRTRGQAGAFGGLVANVLACVAVASGLRKSYRPSCKTFRA
jgi:hypothetical protein